MGYSIVVSEYAEANFRNYLDYVTYNLENFQAALSILRDYDDAIERLLVVADGSKLVEDEALAKMGYRTLHLKRHRLFLVYRISEGTIYVDAIFHSLQDYENIFKSELRIE